MGNLCGGPGASESHEDIDHHINEEAPPSAGPARHVKLSVKGSAGKQRPQHNMKVVVDKSDTYLVHVKLVEASGLISADLNGYSDPYVKITLGKDKAQSNVKDATLNPVWNEFFTFGVNESQLVNAPLSLTVFDHDMLVNDDFLGKRDIDLGPLLDAKTTNGKMSGWYELWNKDNEHAHLGSVYVIVTVEKLTDELRAAITGNRNRLSSEKGVQRKQQLHNADDEREKEDPKTLQIFIGSWNAGNAPPPDDLSPWLTHGADICVIGGQEAEYKPRSQYSTCGEDWSSTLSKHYGDEYKLLEFASLMQIRICVFVKKEFLKHIDSVSKSEEATGIGHVVGNKGGVAVALTIHDTSFCFVNSHLAAHQDKTSSRNSDVAEIIGGLKMGGARTDIVNQFHHVIWMGDLNYRLNYGDQGMDKSPSEELFNEMTDIIHNGDYLGKLLPADQLNEERKKGNVFLNFEEGQITFKPTFKVKRDEALTYNKQRSPAWCDRILWKSFLCGREHLTLTKYEAAPDILTSDHKPIRALFNTVVRTPNVAYSRDVASVRLVFDELSCTDLPIADHDGTSDPYVSFFGTFLDRQPKTAVIENNLNPTWDSIPHLHCAATNLARLGMEMLQLRVKDYDSKLSTGDLLGAAALQLQEWIDGKEHSFDVQLTRDGLPAGRIKGTMHMVIEMTNNSVGNVTTAKKFARKMSSNAAKRRSQKAVNVADVVLEDEGEDN